MFIVGSKFKVHLHTSISDSAFFKASKFPPDRNHVRRNFLNPSISSDESGNVGPPTPHYNAAMLSELGAKERHLHEIYTASQECPGIVDAVVMCKIWARQRGLDKVSCEGILIRNACGNYGVGVFAYRCLLTKVFIG